VPQIATRAITVEIPLFIGDPLLEEFANRTRLRLNWNVSNDNYPVF
jgi:hypothetical protein